MGDVVINVSGCLLLGALMVVAVEIGRPSRYLRPFLGVGVLGGFTTFATYTAEVRALLKYPGRPGGRGWLGDGGRLPALGALLAGLVAVWLGAVLARLLSGRRRRPASAPQPGSTQRAPAATSAPGEAR